ncbi:MAG: TylF/MycF/NovP-related O-methyltransferase [bacterium]
MGLIGNIDKNDILKDIIVSIKENIMVLKENFGRIRAILSKIKNFRRGFPLLVNVKELKRVQKKALLFLEKELDGKDEIGDYLEFGVCHSSSLLCMYQTMGNLNLNTPRLFGFDSFQGLPENDLWQENQDNRGWRPGQFYAEMGTMKKYLTKHKVNWTRTKLIKGWYKDTLTQQLKDEFQISKASIIMIGCDIYTATKEALDFCKSLIKDVTMIVFDDWNSGDLASKGRGEKKILMNF